MSSGIRMSGIVSGLDTESIVQAMVATQVAKKEKLQKSQTLLEWKQDAYKTINTKINSLYNSISSLRFSSAYQMKTTTVSDSTKATITASESAVNGTQTLQIKKLATSGYLTGAKLKSGTTADTTLGDLGYTDEETTISVTTASGKTDITLNASTTISDLVSKLNNSGVKASFDEGNGRIFISAAATGKDNDFSLTASSLSGLKALDAAGLSVASAANTQTYETLASYAEATEEDTRAAMLEMLTNLKNAYDSNADMTIRENEINEKTAYSNAKDAVDAFNTDDDTALLIKLLKENNNSYARVDEDGNVVMDYENTMPLPTLEEKINELAKATGLIVETVGEDGETTEDRSKLTELQKNVKTVAAIDDNAVLTEEDKAQYYLTVEEREEAAEELATFADTRAANNAVIADEKNAYWDIGDYTGMQDAELEALADKYTAQIMTAKNIVDGVEGYEIPISEGATRVDAEDATIILNNAEFTSSSNVFNINGLTIKATGETKDGEVLTINTDTDTQGLYDKVKEFLSEYNSIINELSSLYNADSSKGYEPLTDDEKAEMSESEIEKWETKIKDSILRRDSTIGSIMNAMTNSMMKSYTINGKTYALSSFGIHTLGYLNAAENENYAYHIDGDSEDSSTSGNTDKLLDMITNNPEDFQEFMKQLTSDLYTQLDNMMKSSDLKTRYTIYNDKQMSKEYDNYTEEIEKWEDKIEELENRYYLQFSNMETQLAKLQSSSSSLSSLFGNS